MGVQRDRYLLPTIRCILERQRSPKSLVAQKEKRVPHAHSHWDQSSHESSE